MNEKISGNQLCAIIFILITSNKLLVLPSILYDCTANDTIFYVLGMFIFDFFCLLICAYVNKKWKNQTFLERCDKVFGVNITKILCFVIFAYFAFKTFLTFKETQNFLSTTIYVDLSAFTFIVLFVMVAVYISSRGMRNVGRVAEVFTPVVIIGILVSFLLAFPQVQIDGILPLFTSTLKDFGNAITYSSVWFGNFIIFFLLVGRVEQKKDTFRKVGISFGISALLVLLIFWFFYSMFGASSAIHHYAIADITSFAPALSSLAKVDWFTVIFYSVSVIIQLVLQMSAMIILLKHLFKRDFGFTFYLVFSLFWVAIYLLLPVGFDQAVQFYSRECGLYIAIFNFLMPILFSFVYFWKTKWDKKDEQKQESYIQNISTQKQKNLRRL